MSSTVYILPDREYVLKKSLSQFRMVRLALPDVSIIQFDSVFFGEVL